MADDKVGHSVGNTDPGKRGLGKTIEKLAKGKTGQDIPKDVAEKIKGEGAE